MHNTSQFVSRLNPAQREVLERIRNRNRLRFGDDLFRMEEGDDPDGGGNDPDGGGNDPDSGTDKVELDKLPKDVQDLVKRYRKEAAEASGKARDEAKRKAADEAKDELMKDIGKKLGFLKDDDKKMTSEEFAAKLAEASEQTTAAQQQAKQTAIELAVYRTASKNDGDADALLDSRAFVNEVSKLDPSAKDFNEKVAAAVKDAVKNNPKLKLQAGAGSGGVDHGAGGSGGGGNDKPKSLADAVSSHYGSR